MVAKTIAWGYFAFGFTLAMLLINENTKKIRVIEETEKRDKPSSHSGASNIMNGIEFAS